MSQLLFYCCGTIDTMTNETYRRKSLLVLTGQWGRVHNHQRGEQGNRQAGRDGIREVAEGSHINTQPQAERELVTGSGMDS